jgi:hypothetical protein
VDDRPLWHYTCPHGRQRIGTTGWLRPFTDGWVWITDLTEPDVAALGLTAVLISCDRTAYRYRVLDVEHVQPYVAVRRGLHPARRDAIEELPGVLLRHWFVADRPVRAELDPR